MGRSLRNVLNNLGNLPQENNGPLRRGSSGNKQTVEAIKELAHKRKGHPLVRKLAENIINQYDTKSQNFLDECFAIGDWVKKCLPYAKDPQGIESIKDPITMIDQLQRNEMRGDCDDMSLLICTLLLSLGHNPYLCIVRYPYAKTGYQHIYVAVYEKNYRVPKRTRLVLDAIVKDKPIGYEVSFSKKEEIKV